MAWQQAHPFHDLPLLLVADPGGIDAVGHAVLRPCRLVADDRRGEMLRDARPFALGHEPLPGAMEDHAGS